MDGQEIVDEGIPYPGGGDSCYGCRFWQFLERPEDIVGEALGFCRRRSPIATADNWRFTENRTEACWPLTSEHSWCGEHEPRKAAA